MLTFTIDVLLMSILVTRRRSLLTPSFSRTAVALPRPRRSFCAASKSTTLTITRCRPTATLSKRSSTTRSVPSASTSWRLAFVGSSSASLLRAAQRCKASSSSTDLGGDSSSNRASNRQKIREEEEEKNKEQKKRKEKKRKMQTNNTQIEKPKMSNRLIHTSIASNHQYRIYSEIY